MISYLSREVVAAPRMSRSSSKTAQKVSVFDNFSEFNKRIINLNSILNEKQVREASKLDREINKSKGYISNQLNINKSVYDFINIKDIYEDILKTPKVEYFHILNTHELKEKYEKHISKVEMIRNEKLDYLFSNTPFNVTDIQVILNFLRKHFSKDILNSLENNLKEAFPEENGTININYASFLNYLYILPSKKIQKSDIAIDEDTGKIVIFYNSDESNYDSKKISLIPNEKDFTVSIISRKDGLAKFHGVYASRFPEAYYKIELLMETLI